MINSLHKLVDANLDLQGCTWTGRNFISHEAGRAQALAWSHANERVTHLVITYGRQWSHKHCQSLDCLSATL
jgi:hypothetical protein